ncbi:hypothetical protein B0T19DRAFT_446454 [Cercophora scortea]|uniref:Uncharacterized protein n=1 Tax=Cercophora scortea TaxID=314031 RepID=A0AAE0I3B0_9PEZI|nr:hypothetical protein B0T19DRAFT_446454 [Cercophora scortea]
MATIKQVLITLAITAVSALASPALSTNATATPTAGAPKPAVSQISKGKELEDFLAGWPYTPDGSIDVTNTKLAAELIKFHKSHSSNTTSTLTKRSGNCDQGSCPDFFAAFDLAHRIWKDNGDKSCYIATTDYFGYCGAMVASKISHPIQEVACTW